MSFLINPFAFAVAGGDYEAISSVTVGSGGASSIEFTSIPSTFAHLQIRGLVNKAGANGNWGCIKINGSTSGYASHLLQGNGSSATASAVTTLGFGYYHGLVDSTTYGSAIVVDILDYANTSKNTTIRSFSGNDYNGSGSASLTSTLWASTSAVTSISYGLDIYNLGQYSTLALYGIKAP